MPISLLLFLLLLSCAKTTTTITATHNRRILHQPFLPQDSVPPTQPPSPQPPTPKVPFSTSPPSPPSNQPFFPTFPSPPPPPSPPSPSSTFASFPANISSLSLPKPPKSKPISSKLIGATVSAVLSAVAAVCIIIFLHIRRRNRRHSSFSDAKTSRSDNSNSNNANGCGTISTTKQKSSSRRSAQTSSEFLYLGTMVNSHGGIVDSHVSQNNSGRSNVNSQMRKFDSPELRPLPPLSAQQNSGQQQSNRNPSGVGSTGDEDDESFYSPRGSTMSNGSASGRAFEAVVAARNFDRSSSSGTTSEYSSSNSGSPVRSVSVSISPPVSLSPKASIPKSPELAPVHTAPPPPRPPPPPPPPPPPSTIPAPVDLLSSPSPPRTSKSSSGNITRSPSPSPRTSKSSSGNITSSPSPSPSPCNVPAAPPQPPLFSAPPPPPLPPLKHWESLSPTTPTPAVRQPISKPPPLIAPSRPVTLPNPSLISPMELPSAERNEETPKPKLKPLHWDKVRASSDREMVWDQLKSSSFKLNEEMIETLFVVKTPNSNPKEAATRRSILPSPSQEDRVLDPKKSQNIAILLRAINVTIEEVCEALLEGNAETLGTELLESLLKMAPTKEEERKLKEYKDDSPVKLGPAERFLKAVLDIPFAFKRLDAMLYISNFDSEIEYLKKSFETLEAACEELRSSRMFLKLLEAVLKTGNRMNVGTNRGDAHAFKLDTLHKLVDVKGADGKTTLLHFVVQEIIRSEGARLSGPNQNGESSIPDDVKCRKLGLQVVSGISSELTNVKKAAAMDSEVLNGDVMKLSKGIGNIAEVVRLNEATGSQESTRRFSESMSRFTKIAEEEIIRIQAQESVALSLVKEITEYFHGNSAKEEAHPFRIFMVVRDFLMILDRVCKEVGMINERTIISSAHKFPVPVNPTLPPVFNGAPGRRQYISSDDESSSP